MTVCEKEREEDKRRNKQRTPMKTKNDPPNDPRTTLRTTPGSWAVKRRPRAIIDHNMKCATPCHAAPLLHPELPNHQKIKNMNLPPIQKRYVRGMTKGTFPPCKLNMLEQPQQIIYNMVIQEPNRNTWVWPTKAYKPTQQITAHLIGTATIATTPLKSFAQWYGLKAKNRYDFDPWL